MPCKCDTQAAQGSRIRVGWPSLGRRLQQAAPDQGQAQQGQGHRAGCPSSLHLSMPSSVHQQQAHMQQPAMHLALCLVKAQHSAAQHSTPQLSAARPHLALRLVEAQLLVAVAVHNAADDVDRLRVQLHTANREG